MPARRVAKLQTEFPAKIVLSRNEGKVLVSIFRTDMGDPGTMAVQFHIDPEEIRSGRMCLVAFGVLQESLRKMLGLAGLSEETRGKRRSKPRRIPGKQREFRMLHSGFPSCWPGSRPV